MQSSTQNNYDFINKIEANDLIFPPLVHYNSIIMNKYNQKSIDMSNKQDVTVY